MASTYSTNLRLELIGTGEQQGSWGITTNTNLGTLIEEAIGGYVSVPVTDGADTVLTANNGTADQSRNMTLNLTGALTATRNVIAPAIEKIYLVKNATTGGFAVTLKVSGQTGVSIPNGSTVLVYVDGTDVRYLTGSFASYGPVPVTSSTNTFTASQVINVTDNTNAALRITQLGTGNALLVEDSSNPDSTPLVVDANGFFVQGHTAALQFINPANATMTFASRLLAGTSAGALQSVQAVYSNVNTTISAGYSIFARSNTATVGSQAIVSSGDLIGGLSWQASDGTNFVEAARLTSFIDGTPGTGDMPGRLVFSTTADGASTPTERMRIDNIGRVGIGATPGAGKSLVVGKAIEGSVNSYGFEVTSTIQSDVTSGATYIRSVASTAASAFTLSSLYHILADQGTFGAGSSVTSQYGFISLATLVGATTNYGFFAANTEAVTTGKTAYGFYSGINAASGGGTTWAFYGNGTANSYFGGNVGIGNTSLSNIILRVGKAMTGGTSAYSVYANSVVQSDVTGQANGFGTSLSTAAAAFTLSAMVHFNAVQTTIGAGSAVTTQIGFQSSTANIGATGNYGFYAADTAAVTAGKTAYGFYSDIDTATGGGTTWAFYGAGTANSYFGGSVGIGSTALTGYGVRSSKSITGATSSFGITSDGQVQSDVTVSAQYFRSVSAVVNAAFTTSVTHYNAVQGTFGASATVTEQLGYSAAGTLIGATSNYGFFAANTAAVTSGKTAYGFYSQVNIASGGGTTWAFYGGGTAPSYFGGSVGIGTTSLTGINLFIEKNITGATTSYGVAMNGTVQSDVTVNAFGFNTFVGTAAASFTLSQLIHYRAVQATFGASSAVTTQIGFNSNLSLIGATNNYAFSASDTAAVTSGKTAYGFHSNINIATGGGTTWAYYGAGTAWSFFAGPVILDDTHWMNTPAPTAKSTTATLTGAEVKTQMVTLTGTSYTVTMPTGTNLDAAFSGIPATVDIGFDLYFINSASGTVTIAVNTGITSVGTLTIATGVSAHFLLRRTAANTYVMYRVS